MVDIYMYIHMYVIHIYIYIYICIGGKSVEKAREMFEAAKAIKEEL
jgi:hypothetical protein